MKTMCIPHGNGRWEGRLGQAGTAKGLFRLVFLLLFAELRE